jgi:molybdopterin molybdotransferase
MFAGNVAPGCCVRLFTGSPLPRDADAVVMQEDTQLAESPGEEILVLAPTAPWENTRLRGEDIRQGALLAESGSLLRVGHLSLLAATGVAEVNVGIGPVTALLATGSELREPGATLEPGQIFESNRIGLASLVRGVGGISRVLPLVPDRLDATRLALIEAFEQCDMVITSGGVSVGEMDFVKRAFEEIGGEMQFWKVAIKPGRPFVFGRWRDKFLFGLPGNPASALVTFLLLVRPALLRWQGSTDIQMHGHPGTLREPLANRGDRRHFIRVKIDAAGNVSPAGIQASHILSSLAAANGLVDVPPQRTLPSGTAVQVMRWD